MPTARQVGLQQGFRSGLEEKVARQIQLVLNEPAEYEQYTLEYTRPAERARYTPDFLLPNGIIIETKGRFTVADRKKHLLIKEQYPELDIRFVFSNSNTRLSKSSKTSYAAWCKKHGFIYHDKIIPQSWFDEPSSGFNCRSLLRYRSKP